jgi:hypothetical protein
MFCWTRSGQEEESEKRNEFEEDCCREESKDSEWRRGFEEKSYC